MVLLVQSFDFVSERDKRVFVEVVREAQRGLDERPRFAALLVFGSDLLGDRVAEMSGVNQVFGVVSQRIRQLRIVMQEDGVL